MVLGYRRFSVTPNRFFYDTEFLEDGRTIDLISIGIVDEDGDSFYAINRDMPLNRIMDNKWLVENVLPDLPIISSGIDYKAPGVMGRHEIATQAANFITRKSTDSQYNELWAYYGAYDHVVLSQLYGAMVNLPNGMPMFTRELMQLWWDAGRPPKPPKFDLEHNALADALWNRKLYRTCINRKFLGE